MKKMILMSLVATSMLFFGGCANKSMKDSAERVGFLGGYDNLKEDKNYKGVAAWLSSTANFKKYDSVMVLPVKINHGVTKESLTPAQEKLFQEMSSYLTKGFEQQIGASGKFKIVKTPSPTTMKLEAQIAAVSVNHDDLKFYQFIPIALVATAVARVANISKASARVLGEGMLTDSTTNEPLLKTMSLQKGQEIKSSGKELVFSDVKPALDIFLSNSAKRVAEIEARAK